MKNAVSTREQRIYRVAQVNANMGIENMEVPEFTKALQQRYIDGEITSSEMTRLTMEEVKRRTVGNTCGQAFGLSSRFVHSRRGAVPALRASSTNPQP